MYKELGFINLHNTYHVVRAKSENFTKEFFILNKSLLVSPKYSSSSIGKFIGLSNSNNFEFQFQIRHLLMNKLNPSIIFVI